MSCEINKEGVHWFEIPVTDMNRAKAFYEAVFGLPMTLKTQGPVTLALWEMPAHPSGAGGALIKVEGITPSGQGTLVYFSTGNITKVLARVVPSGGKVLREKIDIGEYGVIAHVEDTEGNRIGLHQAV